ncbi:hypothetical protein [Streptacidiphilus anmyonensis]|uniref:hypothetical protein n=1 Tax=Streptacidiphilus anmyonensis TaxID=405782 RepID=UPI0005A8392F|nr:hypothetical protein [Streptacidiphilus anmyonensis]
MLQPTLDLALSTKATGALLFAAMLGVPWAVALTISQAAREKRSLPVCAAIGILSGAAITAAAAVVLYHLV